MPTLNITEIGRLLPRIKRRILRHRHPPEEIEDWMRVLQTDRRKWDAARKAARNGPKILIATSVGGHKPVVAVETALAMALTLQGAEVHFLLCDGALPACEFCTTNE